MRTILADLPLEIKGLSFFDDLGTQIIILNARYNHETNLSIYEHELSHKDDWQSTEDIDTLEYYRNKK